MTDVLEIERKEIRITEMELSEKIEKFEERAGFLAIEEAKEIVLQAIGNENTTIGDVLSFLRKDCPDLNEYLTDYLITNHLDG